MPNTIVAQPGPCPTGQHPQGGCLDLCAGCGAPIIGQVDNKRNTVYRVCSAATGAAWVPAEHSYPCGAHRPSAREWLAAREARWASEDMAKSRGMAA